MDNAFIPPVSIEQFAAWLDNNLSPEYMDRVELAIAGSPEMEELAVMADVIDEDMLSYLADDFAYEADMAALDGQDIELPQIDTPCSWGGEDVPAAASPRLDMQQQSEPLSEVEDGDVPQTGSTPAEAGDDIYVPGAYGDDLGADNGTHGTTTDPVFDFYE